MATPFDFLKFDFGGKNSALAVGNKIISNVGQFQANGAVDWVLNNHQFTFGADFRRLSLAIGAASNERSVLFAGVTQSLNGTASRISQITRNISESPELNNFSLFAQDAWRISPRLNLNLGLRWDADFAPKISRGALTKAR